MGPGDLFRFTKSERRALVALAVLLILVLVIRWIADVYEPDRSSELERFRTVAEAFERAIDSVQQFSPQTVAGDSVQLDFFNPNTADDSTFLRLGLSKKQIRNIRNYLKTGAVFRRAEDFRRIYSISDSQFVALEPFIVIPDDEKNRKEKDKSPKVVAHHLYPFNPNTITDTGLQTLGFPDISIKALINYRKNGGVFYKAEDILKIYGLDEDFYGTIEPYIIIPPPEAAATKPQTEQKQLLIELNSSTKDQLVKLPGIGPVFADRILKYRELLGGFARVDQVLEVYGMDSLRFSRIIGMLAVDRTKIHRHKINFETENQLAAHPYVNYALAGQIIKNRNRKGSYASAADLQRRLNLSDSLLQKIEPYLYFR